MNLKRGFTLLEVLLVIAIVGILAGIVILALNPGKQLGDANDAERRVDVNTIMNAVYQYALDNDGDFPAGIDAIEGTSQVLGTSASGCDTTCTDATTVTACVDLSGDLVSDYIVDIPQDPSSGTAANTDYYINELANGRLTVGSCDPEQADSIEITR